MTACCCSGYRPLRDIHLDECRWPPVLAPAGPWEICDCAEGDVVRRQRAEPPPLPISGDGVQFATLVREPPTCSTCPGPEPEHVIEWHEHWSTYLCAECGAILAEEKKP